MKFKNLDTDIYLSFRVQGKQHEWVYLHTVLIYLLHWEGLHFIVCNNY